MGSPDKDRFQAEIDEGSLVSRVARDSGEQDRLGIRLLGLSRFDLAYATAGYHTNRRWRPIDLLRTRGDSAGEGTSAEPSDRTASVERPR